MIVQVTGRHLDTGEALKEYVTAKVSRLENVWHNITKVEVIFDSVKGGQYESKIIVGLPRNHTIVCSEREKTLTGAFDLALGSVERQLTDFKEKLRGKGERARETRRFLRRLKAQGGAEYQEMV